MTQKIIKDKLASYLTLKADQLCKEIIKKDLPKEASILKQLEVRRHIEEIKKLITSGGRCFAFAIADGAYSATGYGDWWKEILFKIATWDEKKPEDLEKPLDLKHLLPVDSQKNVKTETLDNLFERVLNTIIVEHSVVKEPIRSFMLEGQGQIKYLNEDSKFFEIMIDNKIQNIKSRDVIGGQFSTEMLASVFAKNKEMIAGNICLVHAEDHAMNIKYENNQWVLYDPNYDHSSVTTMIKRFDNEEELVKEMKIRLRTEAIAVQIATLKPDQKISFSFYENLSNDEIKELIKGDGLQAIARRAPESFEKILQLAESNSEISNVLAEAIRHKNKLNWSGLFVIARYDPSGLEHLLEFANKNDVIANSIANSILIENSDQWNGLHMIVKTAPNVLPKLLELANKNPKVSASIISALDRPNKNGNTPRTIMANNADLRQMLTLLNTLELAQQRKNASNDAIFTKMKKKSNKKKPPTSKSSDVPTRRY